MPTENEDYASELRSIADALDGQANSVDQARRGYTSEIQSTPEAIRNTSTNLRNLADRMAPPEPVEVPQDEFVPPNDAPVAPVITDLSPTSGKPGDTVSITFTGMGAVTDVLFGGTKADQIKLDGDKINAVVPAHDPGDVDVVVVTAAGTSEPKTFTYEAVDAPKPQP